MKIVCIKHLERASGIKNFDKTLALYLKNKNNDGNVA